jgi:hypothetical protein
MLLEIVSGAITTAAGLITTAAVAAATTDTKPVAAIGYCGQWHQHQ